MKELFIQFNSYLVKILDTDLLEQQYVFGPCMTTKSLYKSKGKTVFKYLSKGITFLPIEN